MFVYDLALLLVLNRLRLLLQRALPILLTVPLAILFLPMVLLGAAGLAAWRRGSGRRRRRWLVLLWAAAVLQYAGAARWLGTEPFLLYVLVYLSALAVLVLAVLGQADWSVWQPQTSLAAIPALLPGALIAAAVWPHWPRLWHRQSGLGVYEATGIEIPPAVAARAAQGIVAPPDGWGLGYRSDGLAVTISDAEARHHTLVCGTPGAGKTTILRLILEGVADRCPVVIVDGKASATLRQAVARRPHSVTWTIGGTVRWDALRGDPTSFTGKLLAAEGYTPAASVYEAAAADYVQSIGRLLELEGQPRDPAFIATLLQPPALRAYVRHLRGHLGAAAAAAAAPVLDDVTRILQGISRVELEGIAGFGSRFRRFVKGTTGRSLGAGPDALVLEDALRAGRTVLFSLDAAGYPFEARKVGAWLLLDLVDVAGRLQAEAWAERRQAPAYVLIDEFTGLGGEGVHIVPLLSRGREAGLACVIATQGLADIARIGRAVEQQVLQNTAVKIVLRQGSAEDAAAWAAELGDYAREEVSRRVDDRGRSLGVQYARWTPEHKFPPATLRALGVGDAVLSVPPLGPLPGRQEPLRVAQAAALAD